MNNSGRPERETQNRVIRLFREELGYRYLGDWTDRIGNSNIEESLLTTWLQQRGYSSVQISRAIYLLKTEADNPSRRLYDNNAEVYSKLRYGVDVKTEAGKVTETVHLIDWDHPENNDFCVAEEVTLKGGHERRPDLVLYVNGIAIGVIELKNSRTSIGHGIRQLLSNQEPEFNQWFFSTVQLVFAGSDSEGLQYGTIKTEEKFFLKWKEDEADNSRYALDKYLLKMCNKQRLIELMHDFILFDGGQKKVPRVHQYFGIKAAQEHVNRREGGIIWHTQGSGKSIVMVLLAKWILENRPNARVVVVTDRDELDKQIERVFRDAGEKIHRTSSGADLMTQLAMAKPRLLCSLIRKFGKKGATDFDAFIRELQSRPSQAVGELFIFVDEAHRTQSGKLHRTMKALLPKAVFVGFTGTPLLKADKETSREVFGGYIHTYKFGEAVKDQVVLDLVYEARDIDQMLGSQDRIDAWFDSRTQGLNEWQKATLREHWGTMQKVLSSRSRKERVVEDVIFDFSTRPRLSDGKGTAILVAASIYDACKYFELFQKAETGFRGKCAVVTSYNPHAQDVTEEETGANTSTEKQFIYDTYIELLKDVQPVPHKTKTEVYEDRAKTLFREQPANMKLLIVVDKLLTGFDAPSCTYLYIDKSMKDHGLFQAICRTNRLDGPGKQFGYIVDYKDLFKNLVNDKGTGALQVYSSELDDSKEGGDPNILMQDRLTKGREKLDNAIEQLELLCEPVQPPRADLQFIQYFCGNVEIPEELEERGPQRVSLYKGVASLLRSYASIADDLAAAGYSGAQASRLKQDVEHYVKVRETIRMASGETLDLKAYEADMRHLIDTYIEASTPRKVSAFDDMGLLDLIERLGMDAAIATLPDGVRGNQDAIAETIMNNVRSKIVKEHLNDPAYYDRMSALLKEIIDDLRAKRISYAEFLKRVADAAKKVNAGQDEAIPEPLKRSPALRALYNNLKDSAAIKDLALAEVPEAANTIYDPVIQLAQKLDTVIRRAKPDDWRGVQTRELVIKQAMHGVLKDAAEVERLFLIVKQQSEY
ncbi:MAG: HsdR family type I site-specific deoxyribonuclease [Planctomycetaceae bacterium]